MKREPAMEFLNAAWYVAAWSEELSTGLMLARTFLDQPVVLFRDAAGRAAALFDRCPHRFAPLSRGRLQGDSIECGYHGLGFDRSGACVRNPYGSQIPPRAHVRSFSLLERDGIVWIWMGDEAGADPALAPTFSTLADPDWHAIRGYLRTPANYVLAIDNLMDLTHPEYLHDRSLGSPALKTAHYEVKVESKRVIHSNRWFDSGPLPPLMERHFPTNGRPVEHWINMRWEACSSLWLEVGATLVGRPRNDGWRTFAAHLLTPETATSTHYFYAAVFGTEEARAHINDGEIRSILANIFAGEDSPMLEAVQSRMAGADLWALKPVSLPGDAGAVQVRRALAELTARQSDGPHPERST
jgi:phenylpropionate dioxygenase-like ring-hydroxylating dioxygenase large terminal subunit